MSDDSFGKWWPCLKKHQKRLEIWLPHLKRLHSQLSKRGLRYFTLCARPMIDVFMLVREGVVFLDKDNHRIEEVTFCELDSSIFAEMKELVGVEEAGFLGKLEDIILFKDDSQTAKLETLDNVRAYIEKKGEDFEGEEADKVFAKRRHLEFKDLFPFDFLNLDFCAVYYDSPPNVLRVHQALGKILEWQRIPGRLVDEKPFQIDKFATAITTRVNSQIPEDAVRGLSSIVRDNCAQHRSYREAVEQKGFSDLDTWIRSDRLDFFMSSWPKDIAKLARDIGWDIEILDHVFYSRVNDEGEPYDMICLVLEFKRTNRCTSYLSAAIDALNGELRSEILKPADNSAKGRQLLNDLEAIVALRNEQAKRKERSELPNPRTALRQRRSEGVEI